VFVNIAGGMTVDEPASDLGVLAAIASSVRNRRHTSHDGDVRRSRSCGRTCRGITQAALRASRSGRRWGSAVASCRRRTSIRPIDNWRKTASSSDVRTVGEALTSCSHKVHNSGTL